MKERTDYSHYERSNIEPMSEKIRKYRELQVSGNQLSISQLNDFIKAVKEKNKLLDEILKVNEN